MGITIPIAFLVCVSFISATCAEVTLTIDGLSAQIKNENVELNFNSDATLTSLYVQGTNIAVSDTKTFYLDWNSGGALFSPSSIQVVEQTSDRAHFYWLQDNVTSAFRIELHYVMVSGLDGVYSYAKFTNAESVNQNIEDTRTVYKFDPTILTQGTNQKKSGTLPRSAELDASALVFDSTYQFSNGTYYSKFDYAAYIRETDYQGVYGNGYGAFLISPSREYHGGGPLKQDLTVYEESIVSNYFWSTRFGTPELNAPPGWSHIYGPFLLYFPSGDDSQVITAVENQVTLERANWPYAWVSDVEYPLERGSIIGTVNGQVHAAVLAWDSTTEEFDMQQLGYLYFDKTDKISGNFSIDNLRPGTYRVAAYPLSGQGIENVARTEVTVTAGGQEQIVLTLPEPDNIIWSVGEANRRSREFNYASQPRNYQWQFETPVTNDFTIDESDSSTDWYYAQSQPGHWYIKYQDTADGKQRLLRVALAAASNYPHLLISVNGQEVADEYLDDDQAIYRGAMQSGRFYSSWYNVTADQVVTGENVIDLYLSEGQVMYDVISLQLEN